MAEDFSEALETVRHINHLPDVPARFRLQYSADLFDQAVSEIHAHHRYEIAGGRLFVHDLTVGFTIAVRHSILQSSQRHENIVRRHDVRSVAVGRLHALRSFAQR